MNSPPKKMKKTSESGNGESEVGEGALFVEETETALQDLDKVESELDTLNKLASTDVLKIEQKYNKLRKPIIEKRNDLIPKVPHFWVTAFVNHPDLGPILDESEEDCLHHLRKLEVEEFDDIISGYRINLHFDENPYFENTLLTKEFNYTPEGEVSSHSTEIAWKGGFDLTENLAAPKSRKRMMEPKSFFLWFNDNTNPSNDDIAEIIKDDLFQHPLHYFLVPDVSVDNCVEDEGDSEEEDEDDETALGTIQEDQDEVSNNKSDSKNDSTA